MEEVTQVVENIENKVEAVMEDAEAAVEKVEKAAVDEAQALGVTLKEQIKGKVLKVGAPGALVEIGKDKPAVLHISEILRPEGKENCNNTAELLNVGDETVRVIHTPGHTQGSCVFETSAGLITGDTLFSMGHGRTDLYSGDDEQMLQSLMKLQKMSGRLRIYPGHGGGSTLSAALWDCGLTGRNEIL